METPSVSSPRVRLSGAPLPLPRVPLVCRVRSRRLAPSSALARRAGSSAAGLPALGVPSGCSLASSHGSPFGVALGAPLGGPLGASLSGARPPALASALHAAFARTTREALAWAAFAGAHPSAPALSAEALYRKAVEALGFTASAHAQHFAIPSKLAGTGAHQAAVRELAALDALGEASGVAVPYRPLFALAVESGLSVGYLHPSGRYVTLGRVQDKHAAWARPLLPCGLRLYLLQVTGLARPHATLGVNIAFGHVAGAIANAAALDAERAAEEAAAEAPGAEMPGAAGASAPLHLARAA